MSPSNTPVQVQSVESGDLFKSNDKRDVSPRIIRVVSSHVMRSGGRVEVETVEHWDEKRIGKRKWIQLDRLERGRNRDNGYTKVSH